MNPFDVDCAFVIKEAPAGGRRSSAVPGKTVPAKVASRGAPVPAPNTAAQSKPREKVAAKVKPPLAPSVPVEKRPRPPRADPRPATAAPTLPLRNHPQTRPHAQQQRKPVVAFASSATSGPSSGSAHWNADLRVPDCDTLLIESDLQIYLLKLARWKAGEGESKKRGEVGNNRLPKNLPRGNSSPRSRSAFGTSGPVHSKKREDTDSSTLTHLLWNVGVTPGYLEEEQARSLPPPRPRPQSTRQPTGKPTGQPGVAGMVIVEREQDL